MNAKIKKFRSSNCPAFRALAAERGNRQPPVTLSAVFHPERVNLYREENHYSKPFHSKKFPRIPTDAKIKKFRSSDSPAFRALAAESVILGNRPLPFQRFFTLKGLTLSRRKSLPKALSPQNKFHRIPMDKKIEKFRSSDWPAFRALAAERDNTLPVTKKQMLARPSRTLPFQRFFTLKGFNLYREENHYSKPFHL